MKNVVKNSQCIIYGKKGIRYYVELKIYNARLNYARKFIAELQRVNIIYKILLLIIIKSETLWIFFKMLIETCSCKITLNFFCIHGTKLEYLVSIIFILKKNISFFHRTVHFNLYPKSFCTVRSCSASNYYDC